MALSQNTYVYMETMEIAQNKEEKSDKNGIKKIEDKNTVYIRLNF